MRKVILLAIVGGLVGLLRPEVASAQSLTQSIYAVKFVCGRQGPASTDTRLPAEPPVKPGNYATKVNVELLSPVPALTTSVPVAWNVSIADVGVTGLTTFTLTQLRTRDITCADIVNLVNANPTLFPSGVPQFINGYVNIIVNSTESLAVTGVYTSQGCFFGQSGDSQGAPICTGPVSIEVVPETGVPFVAPPG